MSGKTILIHGTSHDSINAAIWLASLGHQVQFLGDVDEVDGVLTHYKFDHQMFALWQMYCQMGKICVKQHDGVADYLWLFVGTGNDGELDDLVRFADDKPVIISGSLDIGQIDTLAKRFYGKVCYVPFVFSQEGSGFASISSPDLVLIGEKNTGDHHTMDILLSLIVKADNHYVSDIATIEFARSSIMAMLATRLSFINEMARLADESDVDIAKVQAILGLDQRIGDKYLSAGWGFGGHTLPTETALLDDYFAKKQVTNPLLTAVIDTNTDQKELIFRKFWQYFDGFIDQKTVMIWGAGYRQNTGRTTNGAIHPLLKLLWSYGIKTNIYAPNAGFELAKFYGNEPLFGLTDDAYALDGVQALFVLNWSDVTPPDVAKLNQFVMPIFDAKNLFDDHAISELVADYHGIGRNKNGAI